MNTKTLRPLFFVVLILTLVSLACNAIAPEPTPVPPTDTSIPPTVTTTLIPTNTATIANAHMAVDEMDSASITAYAPDTPSFYCYFDLKNAPDDTVIKGTWTLVSAEGYDPNQEIDSAQITGGSDTYYFSLGGGTDAWPVGQYKIDLYLNDTFVQTVNFEVK